MLVPFNELTEDQLAQVATIYTTYFAVPWEWPPEELYGLGRTLGGRIHGLAALDGEAVAGFIVVEYLPGGRLWYIRYLAVRPELRARGWGSRILEEVLPMGEDAARAHGHAGCVGTLLEVEVLEGAASDADLEERTRRQAFYRRHGALMSGARDLRFPWAPAEMPNFELMFIPMSAWDGRVDDALRYRLIRSLIVQAYSIPEDEPWLLAALAPFAGA